MQQHLSKFLRAFSSITQNMSHLCGPDRLIKWMKDFEAETIFLGRTFKQFTGRQQHSGDPVT